MLLVNSLYTSSVADVLAGAGGADFTRVLHFGNATGRVASRGAAGARGATTATFIS